jgi:hypothetical protein
MPHRFAQKYASSGEWQMMEDGRWKMEDGRWKMEDGRWEREEGK